MTSGAEADVTALGDLLDTSEGAAATRLFGTGPEARFDRVLHLAAEYFGVSMAALALVRGDHAWFKSRRGFEIDELRLAEDSLVRRALEADRAFVIEDVAADAQTTSYLPPAGIDKLGFFAGVPLIGSSGARLGVFALGDATPRRFPPHQVDNMRAIAVWLAEELGRDEERQRAAQVQQALLPRQAIRMPGYQIGGTCVPSRDVGGDLYDWYRGDEGLSFTVADVMGKGVGAAIIAATVRASLRGADNGTSPAKAVARTAALVENDLEGTGAFVTAFHGRLRQADGTVRYVDAGHGLALHVHADGTWERLADGNLPLGMSLGEPYTTRELKLEPGDMLVVFSDGVLDLEDGTLESCARVAEVAIASDSVSGVVGSIRSAALDASDIDDVTVVAIYREP